MRKDGGQCSSPSKMADTFDVSKRLLIDICQTEVCFFLFFLEARCSDGQPLHVLPMDGWMWLCDFFSLSFFFVCPSLHRDTHRVV